MMRRLAAKRDEGSALVVTLMLGVAMMILVAGALGVVTTGLRAADTSQDSTGALDAAYSGVQDYLTRFNADSSYENYGNPASSFTTTTGSSVTLPTGSSANPAFGVAATGASAQTSWATVPGSGGASTFRYEIDNHAYASNGIVRIRSTGRVGNVTRSLLATVHQKGFTDYVYFTDYEIQDPLISGQNATTCVKYLWAGRDTSQCTPISFGVNDVLNGPVHSNDSLTVCGTTFNASVETGRTGGGAVLANGCAAGTGTYARAGDPAASATLALPASNSKMRAQTDLAVTSSPGCLYTGPTTIKLTSDGKMTVYSPWTKHTVILGTTGFSDAYSGQCGDVTALNSTSGATVAVPTGNVVYVQSVPTNILDPNYTSTLSTPANFKCLAADGSTVLTGSSTSAGWIFGSGSTAIRHPLASETPATGWSTTSGGSTVWNTTTPAYGCRSGDAYVEGTATGRLSIAAENYVYVTGDITYGSTTNDILGLVGTNGVIVYNPMQNGAPMLSDTSRTIKASMLSTSHTFQVQNYTVGGVRGYLNIYGSLAQKFRGPVGTSNSGGVIVNGYRKNYVYDPRLKNVGPPYFLTPSISSFKVSNYATVAVGFSSSGAQAN